MKKNEKESNVTTADAPKSNKALMSALSTIVEVVEKLSKDDQVKVLGLAAATFGFDVAIDGSEKPKPLNLSEVADRLMRDLASKPPPLPPFPFPPGQTYGALTNGKG